MSQGSCVIIMGVREEIREREEKEKEEVIELLREQLQVEGKLVGLYEKTSSDIQNKPVRHLLHMIQLDSRKHIDICQTTIEILQGEDVLKEEKKELLEGLREHMELEKGSIDRANKILKSKWITENQALEELIKKLRDDENRHHKTLSKLTDRTFFRLDPRSFYLTLRGIDFVEERYRRTKEFRESEK